MNFDLEKRIPDDIDFDMQSNINLQLTTMQDFIDKKSIELATIKALQYLKECFLDCPLIFQVKYDKEDVEFYGEWKIDKTKNNPNNYSLEPRYNALMNIVDLNQQCLRNYWYKSVTFVNNELGRDDFIKFMIGEKWQEWKKEGNIIDSYQRLSKNIPNKNIDKQNKKKL